MFRGKLNLKCLHSTKKCRFGAVQYFKLSLTPQVSPVANITSFSRLLAKLFIDSENKFAHDALASSMKNYQIFQAETTSLKVHREELISILDPSKIESDVDNVFENFCGLCRLWSSPNSDVSISDSRYKPFVEIFCRLSHKLSDAQLLDAMRYLTYLPSDISVKAQNFVEIWNTLDVVCTDRIDQWNTDQLLLYCDAWYTLNLGRICDFIGEALRRMDRKIKRMTPEQLVQTMFFCNVVRRPIIEMFQFEINLASCIDSLSLREVGVMAMGFFKTQTPIRNPELIAKIYRRLISEADKVEDITLVSLLKVLRYSSRLAQADLIGELLETLCSQVERISLLSCLHVALLGTDIHYCHDACFERVLQRFDRDLEQARLKDMERLCLALSVYNYKSPSGVDGTLCRKILAQLHTKIDEILSHPKCFCRCLHFLSIKGFYDLEMISSVLEPRFLRHTYGKSNITGREIFQLDSFVKINLMNSNYSGHQLSDKYRSTMGKFYAHYIPERNSKYSLSYTDRLLLEVKEAVENIFRTARLKHILPHYERPDIVVCYDTETRKALDLSPECPADYSGAILGRKELLGEVDSEKIDTVVIVIGGCNNMVRDKERHTAIFDLKLEQLKLLKHKCLVIYWHEWQNLETPKDQEMFVKRKLSMVTHL